MPRKRKPHKCVHCGEQFYKQGNAKYCSIDCHLEHNIDRTPGYGENGVCWRWLIDSSNWSGQPKLHTWKFGRPLQLSVRRLLYAKAKKILYASIERQEVRTTCGTEACVNPAHMKLGPVVRGEDVTSLNPHKLDWGKVAEIRALAGSATTGQIGNLFGVTASTVQQIIKNKIWKKERAPGETHEEKETDESVSSAACGQGAP